MKSDDLSLLTVQADGTAEMPPDTVILTWRFEVKRETSLAAQQVLESQAKELLGRLEPHGFKLEDLRLGRDALNIWREWDREAGKFIDRGFEAERRWFLRFPVASCHLGRILDSLKGFPVPVAVAHDLFDPNLLEDESLRLAVLKARRQAELMALAAGVKLGRLVSLVRGELRIRHGVDYGLMACEAEAPSAQEIEGTETVTMSWEIVAV